LAWAKTIAGTGATDEATVGELLGSGPATDAVFQEAKAHGSLGSPGPDPMEPVVLADSG
jgi:hypothetical protein